MDNIVFLDWLRNRLIYKHGYSIDHEIIQQIASIISGMKQSKEINISDKDLDIILNKHYADFNMEYTEDLKLGFTEDERKKLRRSIRLIVDEINNSTISH